MEILFEYSDGVRVGLSIFGEVAAALVLFLVLMGLSSFLIAWKEGELEMDTVAGLLVVCGFTSGVLVAARQWLVEIGLLFLIVALAVGLVYGMYRLGLRLHNGYW